MKRYLHGFNDPGAESLHGDRPGWTLVNEQVGLNTSHGGRNYDFIASRGIGVVVRMNHAYGSGGTIPLPTHYREYAQACASFARNSSPVDYFIVANEPNLERPHGVVILPADYARCFAMTYEAIKKAKPNAKIVPAALAPYNASPMPWVDFMADMLEQIANTTGCDAVNFHAYTRSMNPQDIYSNATMGAPLEGLYYGFKTCEDALLKGTPTSLRHLPAMNTEFDVYDAWEDRNTGVITEHYKYFNDRNAVPGNQQVIMSLCFRWLGPPDVENEKDWEIRNKPQLLEDFRAAVGRGYTSPVGSINMQPPTTPTHSPSPAPDLPRDWDARLTQRGVTIETPPLQPGQRYWRVKRARWFSEQEAGGRHHIYVNAPDGTPFKVTWPSGEAPGKANGRDGFDAGNFPMSASLKEFSVRIDDGKPSETLTGIGMGANGNPGIHTSTFVKFELATVPQATTPQHETHLPNIVSDGPTPDAPQPATVPQLAHPIADASKRVISQHWGENGHRGIDYAVVTGTPIGAVDGGTVLESQFNEGGYGEYVKLRHTWGESLYAHLKARKVDVGEVVNRGMVVGHSGNTGNSTGPHLHFAIRINPYNRADGKDGFSDPSPYLPTSAPQPAPQPTVDVLAAIKAAAQEFGIEWQLLASQAWAESSWRPDAVSSAGAQGLLQIMPATWAEWSLMVGVSDPFNALDNARVGARYLRWLLAQTNGNVYMALHAYVWGIGNVLAYREPPGDVVAYAHKIVHGRDLLKAVG